MVCKETTACPEHGFLLPEETTGGGDDRRCGKCGRPVETGRVEKMSKSKKNVIDPQPPVGALRRRHHAAFLPFRGAPGA